VTSGSPRQLWLLPVLLITVIATALGALVTRDLYAEQETAPPAVVQSSRTEVPPSEQPGSPKVQGTPDAAANPLFRTLQSLLQRYFDAVNATDFDAWSTTVTAQRLEATPREKWETDYRSTKDGNILIYRIEATGDDTARVLLHFTSTQDPASAPPELPVDCIHWNLVWAFERERGEWLLAAGTTSQSPQHEACKTQ